MLRNLFAALITAGAVLAPTSLIVAPVTQAAPCRVIPAPGCDSTIQPNDPMKPKEAKQGKKSPRSAGNPSAR
ncbi:hypothetical protein ASE48_08520 [Mycobacterium sp. Root265]|uniref:hypothetical protein n=1 Tax=Mycobacterium sp. Root265 TaxID=1736504 RepID=UPI00070DDEC7|nr:hypothetical protein [Mycobacterium sp. Root265]KRD08598.1 hypothetical protein ASE48_08520 [Mycobacterium sp. Root265]